MVFLLFERQGSEMKLSRAGTGAIVEELIYESVVYDETW